MKERLAGFVEALRQAGLAPSLSEHLDAAAAVAVAGVERPVLRECLAATLVKDHTDRPAFDDVFDRYFALPRREARRGRPPKPAREGSGSGGTGEGAGRGPHRDGTRGGPQPAEREQPLGDGREAARPAGQLGRRRALLARPFRDMDPQDVEAIRNLADELAARFRSRCSRRIQRANRGRLDMRRTIRRALSRGGVPLELLHRRPRPGKTDLLALVDLSYSTQTAAEFLLALLAPARPFFRRVTLLAYVDAPVEISVEHGHVVPHAPLDLNARSDFGKVLRQLDERYARTLGRNTVVLVLGDARNNRRPPRTDLLARLHTQVRSLIWLNPELPERWNTGDSVMAAYARHSDLVLGAWNMKTLIAALDRLAAAATVLRCRSILRYR